MTAKALLVLTTCGSAGDADRLARALVGDRLAACVNVVGNVASTYRWRDEVQQEPEWLLVIKTTADRFGAIERAIRAQSGYELPEVLAVEAAGGSAPYLEWLAASVEEV
jgi:periplasmic divalent cation tolerance protein